MWDKQRELHHNYNLPWVVLGDFYEILFNDEKEGGNLRPYRYMQAFRDALMIVTLKTWGTLVIDLPGVGLESDNVLIVLWPMVRGSLCIQAQHFRILIEFIKSDHHPTLLDTEYKEVNPFVNTGPKRFKAKWLQETDLDKRWFMHGKRRRAGPVGPHA
jgi:hypothetical protein